MKSAGRTGERDGKIMARLGHLTGLTPEEGPANGMESGCLWRVADGDWHEVQWARRLLHRSAFSFVFLPPTPIMGNKKNCEFQHSHLRHKR